MIDSLNFIKDFILLLDEEDLYYPLERLFTEEKHNVKRTHGIKEKGKDIIATKENKYNLLISVKKGNINQNRWNKEVLSSIDQLVTRPINYVGVNENLDKRILLVLTGYLEPGVAELIQDKINYYNKFSKQYIDVWDLSKLSQKFYDRLRYFLLFEPDIQKDFLNLISSINIDSYDKSLINNFINKYFSLDYGPYFSFRLISHYLARHSSKINNPYPFLYFIEYMMVTFWKKMFIANNFDKIRDFDVMHLFYIEELKKWISEIDDSDKGLLDINNGISEILTYSVRTFDVIKRLSYYIYYSLVNQYKIEEIDEHINKLIKIVSNNESSNKPLFEINCIDLGVAFFILYKGNKIIELKNWIFNILDFLVSHFSQNYHPVSLHDSFNVVSNFLTPSYLNEKPYTEVNSNILEVIIEYIILIKGDEIFKIFKPQLYSYNMYELIGPQDELLVYEHDFISGNTIQIGIQRNLKELNQILLDVFSKQPILL